MTDGFGQSPSQVRGVRRVVVAGCPGCHRPFAVPAKYAGRRVSCPKCNTGVDVPTGSRELVAVECVSCRHKFAVPADFSGRKVRCPECSTFQQFGAPSSAEVISETPSSGSGSKSGSAGSSSSSAIRRCRRFVYCSSCRNVFPVLVDKPTADFSCPKCRHTFLDSHCVRQDELTALWFHHTSVFGGIKYGPYKSREEATAAMLESMHKRR